MPGGRPKGAKNHKNRLEKFLTGVFSEVDPAAFGRQLLRSTDEKVRLQVFLKLIEYYLGKPSQIIETTGPDDGAVKIVIETIGRAESKTSA